MKYSLLPKGSKPLSNLDYTLAGASACAVCFSLVDYDSFTSLIDKWIPTIRQHIGDVPVIALGMKSDMRDELIKTKKQSSKGLSPSPSPDPLPEIAPSLLEASTHEVFNINTLPSEVMQRIFLYLDIKSRAKVSEVCKRWHRLSKDGYIWQGIIKGHPIKLQDVKRALQSNEKTKNVVVIECNVNSKQSVHKAIIKCIHVTAKLKQSSVSSLFSNWIS